jgi:hypothetical protein
VEPTNIGDIDTMNALSIVYALERLLKRYRSHVANSYWVMGLICNGGLSAMDRGGGVSVCNWALSVREGEEKKNLTLKIYTHIFHM